MTSITSAGSVWQSVKDEKGVRDDKDIPGLRVSKVFKSDLNKAQILNNGHQMRGIIGLKLNA